MSCALELYVPHCRWDFQKFLPMVNQGLAAKMARFSMKPYFWKRKKVFNKNEFFAKTVISNSQYISNNVGPPCSLEKMSIRKYCLATNPIRVTLVTTNGRIWFGKKLSFCNLYFFFKFFLFLSIKILKLLVTNRSIFSHPKVTKNMCQVGEKRATTNL